MTWVEQVINPDGKIVGHCGGGGESWDEAQASARYHLASRTTDYHNDDSVHEAAAYLAVNPQQPDRFGVRRYTAEELYEYAAWQRAARAAKDQGADVHRWATEHAREFAVPRPAGDAS